MAMGENPTGHVTREEALRLTVGDVMIPNPKTLPPTAVVGDVRRLFERRGVRTVLLAEDGVFRGALDRRTIPPDAADAELAVGYADLHPTVATPATALSEAIELLERSTEPRLIVLDPDGVTLRGLVCAKPGAATFCVAG